MDTTEIYDFALRGEEVLLHLRSAVVNRIVSLALVDNNTMADQIRAGVESYIDVAQSASMKLYFGRYVAQEGVRLGWPARLLLPGDHMRQLRVLSEENNASLHAHIYGAIDFYYDCRIHDPNLAMQIEEAENRAAGLIK